MDHDADEINQVVLPLLNISRRLPDNTINPKEPNQQVVCATSAGVKTSYAYTRLIDDFIRSIISPDTTFVMGCDYRVPLIHGMLEKDYIDQLRTSPSYDEMSFAREYLGIWSGSSDESWFKFDKLVKLRKIKNPERQKKGGLQAN